MTTTREHFVASEILRQLGGAQFCVMVGAHGLLASPTSLQFKIGSGAKDDINAVTVELTPADTYTVSFWTVTKHGALRHAEVSDVYCDTLQDVFEQHTDFFCTLFPRR